MTVLQGLISHERFEPAQTTSLNILNCYFHCHSDSRGGAIRCAQSITVELTNNAFYHCHSSVRFAAYEMIVSSLVSTQTCCYRNFGNDILYASGSTTTHSLLAVVGASGSGYSTYLDHGSITVTNANLTHNTMDTTPGLLHYTQNADNSVRYSCISKCSGGRMLQNGGMAPVHVNSHINVVGNEVSACVVCAQETHTSLTNCAFVRNAMRGSAQLVRRYMQTDLEYAEFVECKFDFAEGPHAFATFDNCVYGQSAFALSDFNVFATDICVLPTGQHHFRLKRIMFAPYLLIASHQ